jgi:hydrogenase expression/formation protein HypC
VGGVRRTISIGLLDPDEGAAQVGDWVLIHVGFALARINEEEAQSTLKALEEIGEQYEQELRELKASRIE